MNILITHVDLDGIFPNIINELLPLECKFDKVYNLNYGFEETEVISEILKEGNTVTMVDLSVTEPTLFEWRKILNNFVIYDHHESSKYLIDYKDCSWDDRRSGTRVFYEDFKINGKTLKELFRELYLKEYDKIEYLVSLVDTYDRWVDDSELWLEATRLNKLCMGYRSKFISHIVERITSNTPIDWTEEETSIFQKEEDTENRIYEETENQLLLRKDNRGLTFSLVEINNKGKVSMVSSRILRNHKEIDYLIINNCWSDRVSLRARRKDIDLTDIHGVFGHKLAAGAELKTEDKNLIFFADYCFKWIEPNERKARYPIVTKSTL